MPELRVDRKDVPVHDVEGWKKRMLVRLREYGFDTDREIEHYIQPCTFEYVFWQNEILQNGKQNEQ